MSKEKVIEIMDGMLEEWKLEAEKDPAEKEKVNSWRFGMEMAKLVVRDYYDAI